MADEAEKIAASLSEAGQNFMTTITYDGWWRPDEDTPPNMAAMLARKGLLDKTRIGAFGATYRLNQLGLAVRKILQEQQS